jgi:tetratricopeptide (TPR) repeat protein
MTRRQLSRFSRSLAAGGCVAAILLSGCGPKVVDEQIRANQLLVQENFSEAIQAYSEVIEMNSEYEPEILAGAYHNRGFSFYNQRQYQKAIDDYDMSISIDGRNADSYINRANAYVALEMNSEALADFTKAIELSPTYSVGYSNRAMVYYFMDHTAEAIVDIDKAIELVPESARLHFYRGEIQVKAKEYAIAIADYTSACNLKADMPQGFIGRGKCFAAMGHFDKAIADFDRALVIAPENAELLQACAWVLATAPHSDFRNSTRAVSLATKLCKRRKKSWQAFDTLAAAQAEAGRFEEASEAVVKAIELAPDADRPAIEDRGATYAAMKPYHQPTTAKLPLLPEPPEAEKPTLDDTADATVGKPKKVPEAPVP